MNYFIHLLKKGTKSIAIRTVLILVLWGALYSLTDFATVATYFWIGVAVCALNTQISNLRRRKFVKIIHVNTAWVVMAGVVLILYHAGFEAAAVFVAATILALPYFGATIYEGIVGLSLLITLARLMF